MIETTERAHLRKRIDTFRPAIIQNPSALLRKTFHFSQTFSRMCVMHVFTAEVLNECFYFQHVSTESMIIELKGSFGFFPLSAAKRVELFICNIITHTATVKTAEVEK